MNEQEARQLTGRRRELLEILPGLRRFALSLTGSAAAADDLLHATVLRVLKRGLPIEAELLPWCIRVCRHIRMEARERDGQDASPEVEDARSTVDATLAELPDDQRAVLELVAGEGHSYSTAAAMLDLPIGRVMSRLARARGALIERWRPKWQVPLARMAANHD
jgi:DNA-directed RNA polymerase specialized sigma24 family protein